LHPGHATWAAPSSAMIRCATRSFPRLNVPTFKRGSLGAQGRLLRGQAGRSRRHTCTCGCPQGKCRCQRPQRRGEIHPAQDPLAHHRADVGPTRPAAAPRPAAAASPACWTPSTSDRRSALRTRLRGGTGSQSDPELILRPGFAKHPIGTGPARTSALRERRDASRGHTAPAVCACAHRTETCAESSRSINHKFDETLS
jgi:hypothetical protein